MSVTSSLIFLRQIEGSALILLASRWHLHTNQTRAPQRCSNTWLTNLNLTQTGSEFGLWQISGILKMYTWLGYLFNSLKAPGIWPHLKSIIYLFYAKFFKSISNLAASFCFLLKDFSSFIALLVCSIPFLRPTHVVWLPHVAHFRVPSGPRTDYISMTFLLNLNMKQHVSLIYSPRIFIKLLFGLFCTSHSRRCYHEYFLKYIWWRGEDHVTRMLQIDLTNWKVSF